MSDVPEQTYKGSEDVHNPQTLSAIEEILRSADLEAVSDKQLKDGIVKRCNEVIELFNKLPGRVLVSIQ